MYQTWLIPYLEGTLDAERRRQLEARLADDPALTAELNALRRAAPRLRRSAAALRQTEGATTPSAPLWPRLRGRLDPPPARPARGPVFWWIGGLATAGAAAFAALTLWPAPTPSPPQTRRPVHVARTTPRLILHRDNATGTPVAMKLRKRAARVALVERATKPPLLVPRAPMNRLAAAPFAPPLPHVLAGKVPMPVPRPFQMAEREPDAGQAVTDDLAPPTHSPRPGVTNGAGARGARKSAAPDAPPLATAGTAFSLAPAHSLHPSPGPGRAIRVEGMVAKVNNGPVAVPPLNLAPNEVAGGALAGRAAHVDVNQDTPPSAAPAPPAVSKPTLSPMQMLDGAAGTPGPSLQQRLERTVTAPLFGTEAGAQMQQRLLQDAQQAGTLDALAARLEQTPVDVGRAAAQEAVTGRMLAAIYDTDGDPERALAERRRVALLSAADAEDWFELAQTEAHLGNTASAQRAYLQALRAGGSPLSPAHRAIARQNLP